jgi:hypothetical protein
MCASSTPPQFLTTGLNDSLSLTTLNQCDEKPFHQVMHDVLPSVSDAEASCQVRLNRCMSKSVIQPSKRTFVGLPLESKQSPSDADMPFPVIKIFGVHRGPDEIELECWVNKEVQSQLGFDSNGIANLASRSKPLSTLSCLYHQEDLEKLIVLEQEALASIRPSYQSVVRVITSNGSIKTYLQSAKFKVDGYGNFLNAVFCFIPLHKN